MMMGQGDAKNSPLPLFLKKKPFENATESAF